MKTISMIIDDHGNKLYTELTGKLYWIEASTEDPRKTYFHLNNNMSFLDIRSSKLDKILKKFLKGRKKVLDLSRYSAYFDAWDLEFLANQLRESSGISKGYLE